MAQKGRPQGGKNRNWSKEDKLRIVRRYFYENIGERVLAKEENISRGMLHNWIRKYLEHGESALENKKKTGNHFSALHASRNLTQVKRLELTVAKQKVEIARLKKDICQKGVV